MERKITHYLVKPEHREHIDKFIGHCVEVLRLNDELESGYIQLLTEAKVLELWTYPVYEKPRVKGWYNVYNTLDGTHELRGGFESKEVCLRFSSEKCLGQILIDQEIE